MAGVCYVVYMDMSVIDKLEEARKAGKFGDVAVNYLHVTGQEDFAKKAHVITKDDAVWYLGFSPDSEVCKKICYDYLCPVRYSDVAGMDSIDIKNIFAVPKPDTDMIIELSTNPTTDVAEEAHA